MYCPTCCQVSPSESKVCESCGQAFAQLCTVCGGRSPTQAHFCVACSAPLPISASPRDWPSISDGASQARSLVNGRYELRNFLGEGGKKKVFLAYDTLLDREVAFALIQTDALDGVSWTRIEREAQAMGRLGSHPHIVTVFDLGREPSSLLEGSGQVPGQPYMVTELMGGGDVERAIKKAPSLRLPLERVKDIAKDVCRGLEFAHGRGIVHRDLKPATIPTVDTRSITVEWK